MKKAAKILLIIALVLGLVYVGYIAYNKFFSEKFEKMESSDGLVKYLSALDKTNEQEEYTVNYDLYTKDEKAKVSQDGVITSDEFGTYEKWTGTDAGNRYVVKISDSRYGVFEDINGNKQSSTIAASNYALNYGDLENVGYLTFLRTNTLESSENIMLRDFYNNVSVTSGEVKHIFGKVEDGYIWKTTYECTYSENGTIYSSKLVREVYFDSMVKKVVYEKTDKELNAEGKVKRKGITRKFDVTLNITYSINQSILETNFSEYPSV